jgi:hypothetical protein
MNITYRSYLTAGVAALGAGAIALTPIQPMPNHVALSQEKTVANLAVTLASTIDPITPWVDTIKLSAQNIQSLLGFYLEKPFPLIQTVAANTATYFQELTNGNANLIPGQIANNVQTFFQAPWSPGAVDPDTGNPIGEYVSNTVLTYGTIANRPVLPITQQVAFQLLPVIAPDTYNQLKPVIDFTATYYSGQVVGLLGPLFAPLIQLTKSFTLIGQDFQNGDVAGAINELINIPANVTNAVLNGGGVLDLTGVANALAPLPPEIKSIGIRLGGLISPPVPEDGSLVQPDPNDFPAPTKYNGGVFFDTVAAGIDYNGIKINDPGLGVSWIGAAVGLGQFLGQELLVTPPPVPTASVAAAASTRAVVAEAPAAVEEAPAVADDPAPVELAAEVEAPAPQAVSAPAPAKQAAASDNDGNGGSGRGSHTGARGKRAS